MLWHNGVFVAVQDRVGGKAPTTMRCSPFVPVRDVMRWGLARMSYTMGYWNQGTLQTGE